MKKYTTLKTEIIERKYKDNAKKYFVKYVTLTFVKTIFGEKTYKTEELDDNFGFLKLEDAEEFAKYTVKPSKILYLNCYDKADTIVVIYPKNYEKLEKLGLTTFMFKAREHFNSKHVWFIGTYKLDLIANNYNDINTTLSADTLVLDEENPFISVMQNLCENYVEDVLSHINYDSSLIKSFSHYDMQTIENSLSELDKSRNDTIDKELQRIEEYKSFLLSLKK